jgi:hypothetical protein
MINNLFKPSYVSSARYLLMTVSHTIKVSHCVRPELGAGKLEGSKCVASSWYRRGEIFTCWGSS